MLSGWNNYKVLAYSPNFSLNKNNLHYICCCIFDHLLAYWNLFAKFPLNYRPTINFYIGYKRHLPYFGWFIPLQISKTGYIQNKLSQATGSCPKRALQRLRWYLCLDGGRGKRRRCLVACCRSGGWQLRQSFRGFTLITKYVCCSYPLPK